jgi:F-box protein, helicase, 18
MANKANFRKADMKQTHSISKLPQFSTLTREQFGAVLSPAKSIKVVARAGSGKTKTAMGYAAARPKARGLYLAFGKPTQVEASNRLKTMGVNTEARTTHSLAWVGFGSALDAACKLSSNGSLRAGVTADLMGVNFGVAKAVNETVRAYLCSADKVLSDKHLPDDRDFPAVKFAAGAVMDNAQRLWTRMTDLNDSDVKATPDVYLKQWVNTDPKLPYDFILFDECQDANPLSAHLVSLQEHASRLYIGDPHQAIYGFRGAVNLMDEMAAEETHTLTASFRFSKNIGILASTFLQHWKKEPLPLLGLGKGGRVESSDQQAYLARTVAGLIGKGFELHTKGHKLHWVKGFEDYRVAPILEAYRLFKGESSSSFQDPVLKLMKSWTELEDYVEMTGDAEAGPVFRLVEQYRDEIPNIVETLRREQVKRADGAPFVLTTAHKSKGLEWPVVRLTNDYFSFKDPSDSDKWLSPNRIDPQEANLMYVALTRAMKAIAPTAEIVEWFRQQPATAHLFPKPNPSAIAPAPSENEAANTPRAA